METITGNTITITGIVKKFKANKHGDIDALELAYHSQTEKIKFPPHTARSIMDIVNEGDEVEVIYKQELKPGPKADGKIKSKLETIKGASTAAALTISDIKPQKPGFEPHPQTFTLDNFQIIRDKKDEITSIRSGSHLFHIHKNDKSFSALIKPNSKLSINAIKRIDEGFVNAEHLEVYHIDEIEIDGGKYTTEKKIKA